MTRCRVCEYVFKEEVSEGKEPDRYCPQCGHSIFGTNKLGWFEWARAKKLIM